MRLPGPCFGLLCALCAAFAAETPKAAPDLRLCAVPAQTAFAVYDDKAVVAMELVNSGKDGAVDWRARVEIVPARVGGTLLFLRNWTPPEPGAPARKAGVNRKYLPSFLVDFIRRAVAQEVLAAAQEPPQGDGAQRFTFAVRREGGDWACARAWSPRHGNPALLAQAFRVLCALGQMANDTGMGQVHALKDTYWAQLTYLTQTVLDRPPKAASAAEKAP